MADPTYSQYLHLIKLGRGVSPSADSYAFFVDNIDLIDRLVTHLLTHTHDGDTIDVLEPADAPDVELQDDIGHISAGLRAYYRISYLDARGIESVASPVAFVDTPAQVANPNPPTLGTSPTGGVLLPGNYSYALSAYTDTSTEESLAPRSAVITVPAGSNLNENTLTLPTLPAGADGFNVYRRSPNGAAFYHLATVDMTGGTPPTVYVDDGSDTEDCNRGLPRRNTTNSSNSMLVLVPGATPTVPTSATGWRIYRTYTNGEWESSLLVTVTEETFEGSGVITPEYLDMGDSTGDGEPLDDVLAFDNPPKLILTDGANAEGKLPVGLVSGFPRTIEFAFPGPLEETVDGEFPWTCEAPTATILYARAVLGVGSAPASSDVIVDVLRGTDVDNPVYTTIYTNQANRPKVLVGDQRGAQAVPAVTTLVRGQSLVVNLEQIGGGATPTDENLVVGVTIVEHWTSADSDVYD